MIAQKSRRDNGKIAEIGQTGFFGRPETKRAGKPAAAAEFFDEQKIICKQNYIKVLTSFKNGV
ncbi:MAG: hypothetical protein IJT76_07240 [Clostridia bacterium]|nr:hypothetical protein [Clostridia bacterium]